MGESRGGGSGSYKSRSQGPFTESTQLSHVMKKRVEVKGIDTSVRKPGWRAPSHKKDCVL